MEQTWSKVAYARSLTALLVALLVAGCGGSGSAAPAAPLKKPQFVQQANSICKNAEAERNEAMREAVDGEPEAAEFVTEAALPPVQQMTEELGDLGAPVGDQKEAQAIIGAFEAGIKKIEADPTDLTAGVGAFDHANKLALEYGLVDCTI